jgi:hypothetical protein
MGRFLGKRRGSIGVIAGSLVLRDHAERQFGFHQILASEYPALAPLPAVEGRDDNHRTRALAQALLARQPDLVGLYSVGAGNRGIAAALQDSGRAREIVWIAHELTVHTRALLLSGVIDAIINQDSGHARPGAHQHRHLPARQPSVNRGVRRFALGRRNHEAGAWKMHTDLADRGFAASDDDLMDARGDQFTDDRIASGIVRRNADHLARLPPDGIFRISGCCRA